MSGCRDQGSVCLGFSFCRVMVFVLFVQIQNFSMGYKYMIGNVYIGVIGYKIRLFCFWLFCYLIQFIQNVWLTFIKLYKSCEI